MLKLFLSFVLLTGLTCNIEGQIINSDVSFPDYWSINRQYQYTGLYIDSSGIQITREKITMHPTGKIWEADPSQTLMDYQLDSLSADWDKIPTVPLNGVPVSWVTKYQEGVLQTADHVWMHPIRRNQYILSELAPFPEIKLPIVLDATWKNSLWIYKAFGTFEGTVECAYRVAGLEFRDYEFGRIKCWRIDAVGIHDKLGKNLVTYYFNADYGFTEMNYLFYNKQRIEFKLTAVKK